MSVALKVSEDELLRTIVDAAKLLGWLVHHDRRSDRANPQWGSNPGFPDLVLARKGTVLFIETKSEIGKLSEPQLWWSRALFPHWQIIRPADLDWLLEKLA